MYFVVALQRRNRIFIGGLSLFRNQCDGFGDDEDEQSFVPKIG
jgi:hypothetical protein